MKVALILCLLVTTAYADPDQPPPATKDGTVATALAAGVTGVGVASIYFAFRHEKAVMTDSEALMFWGGIGLALVGPAAGHVYVGEKSKMRTLMFVARMIGGLFILVDRINPDAASSWVLPLGIGLAGGATAYDIFDAHRAAYRFNHRWDIKVAPALQPTLTGSLAPGVVAVAAF